MEQSVEGHILRERGKRNALKLQFWLKFVGGFHLVLGGVQCLSLVGIVVGWFPGLVGWWLYKAGVALARFVQSNDGKDLEEVFTKLRYVGIAAGLMVLVSLLCALALVVFYIIAGVTLFQAVEGSAPGWN